jgi:Kef-type K+ transport system membrane component KefB
MFFSMLIGIVLIVSGILHIKNSNLWNGAIALGVILSSEESDNQRVK